MQLASHGLRGFARKPGIGFGGPPPLTGNTTGIVHRSIHYIHHTPTPKVPNVGTAQRLLSQTRNILSRFVAHLTAPGLGTVSSSVGRGMHTSVSRAGELARFNARTSIHQGFSFPARVALSRPLHTPYLPRAPVTPRSVMEVGLGTARKFSTGRPIFQHLVENVPIAGRAFYEADWEIKLQEERRMMLAKQKKEKKAVKKTKEMLKPKVESIILSDVFNDVSPTRSDDLDQYFPLPETADVTTYLLIPLAPTPSARVPLPADTDDQLRLPLRALGNLHVSHSLHSLRISSLFARLDASNVWTRNVKCSAYSHGSAVRIPEGSASGEAEGVCTVLKLEFVGRSKAEVRSVIGESGSGWCVLEEVHSSSRPVEDEDNDDADSILSGMSSEVGSRMTMPDEIDPSRSFVMPTLDFSSSFVDSPTRQSSIWSSPVAHAPDLPPSYGSDFDADVDAWSDSNSDSGSSTSAPSTVNSGSEVFVDPPSTNGYFGFSSDFMRRRANHVRDESEPWENIFY